MATPMIINIINHWRGLSRQLHQGLGTIFILVEWVWRQVLVEPREPHSHPVPVAHLGDYLWGNPNLYPLIAHILSFFLYILIMWDLMLLFGSFVIYS